MSLSQDVLDRLLVAKGLLAKIRFLPVAHPDRISLAQAIFTAHNAAELALAAVATHLGKLPKQAYLLEYFPVIKEVHPDHGVAGHEYFRQLNNVRIAIKHHGNFPEPQQWYRVGERTYEYVSEWCQRYLELSLDKLDQSALIRNQEVKECYDTAMDAFQEGQYKKSLEYLGYATEALFRSNQALRNLVVGKARAGDAIKLAAFGVHANDYLALQEFLPSLIHGREHLVVKWDQKKYGHPGNWTKDGAEFSLKTFVDVALRIQDADWIPGAIEFDLLYEHKITALEDGVEIVQEKAHGLANALINFPKLPEREVVKTLNKGESIRCEVSPKNALGAWLGLETPVLSIMNRDQQLWGEVEASKVRVTCVPKDKDLVRKYFSDLPEVEYEL